MADPPPRKTLARSLGEFFGSISKAVRTDVKKDRREVRREVEEQTRPAPDGGRLTLRRTTTEEIEYQPPEPPTR
jgi:hypothetical protein